MILDYLKYVNENMVNNNENSGRLILGDCLEELKKLPSNSVDALVSDPP